MRTFEVTFTDGSTETFCAERIQFTPTHIVLDNTERSFGIDNRGICNDGLEAAILASTALMVEEIGGASWRRRLQKAAWDEGADFGLATRGYSRRDTNIDGENPYEEKK